MGSSENAQMEVCRQRSATSKCTNCNQYWLGLGSQKKTWQTEAEMKMSDADAPEFIYCGDME